MLPPNQNGPLSINAPTPDYISAAAAQQKARIAQLLQKNALASSQQPMTSPWQVGGNIADRANAQMQLASANADITRGALGSGNATVDALGNTGTPKEGAASVRNNNSGAQMLGPTAKEFGATGSENLAGGNSIAHFNDPVDGAAAHIALLSRNYSGDRVDAAIDRWSGGHNSKGYTDYVTKNAGIPADTVITPQLMQSPMGIKLAKAMADFEADPKKGGYPLPAEGWQSAQNRVFGGGGGGGGGKAPGSFPGGPTAYTFTPPPGTAPFKPQIDPQKLRELLTLQNLGYGDPETARMLLGAYMQEGQPIPGTWKGVGDISFPARGGPAALYPEVHNAEVHGPEGMSFPSPYMNVPQAGGGIGMQSLIGGGGGGSTPPQGAGGPGAAGGPPGPLGINPPDYTGVNVPPSMPGAMGDMMRTGLEYGNKKNVLGEETKNLYENKKKMEDNAFNANADISKLKQMQSIINDPNMVQGWGAGWAGWLGRVKASLNGDPRLASLQQMLDKINSGQLLSTLRTETQGTGQVRTREIEFVEKASLNKYNTKEANNAVVNLQIKSNEYLVKLAELASHYMAGEKFDEKGNIVRDKNGNAVIEKGVPRTDSGLKALKTAWANNHPLLSDKEIENATHWFNEDKNWKPPEEQPASDWRTRPQKTQGKPIGGTLPPGVTVDR